MSLADELVKNFCSALARADFSADKKILSLVDDTYFLGSRYNGNKLYVRDCCHDLSRVFDNHYHSASGQAVTLLRNPGRSMLYIS
jgi:hypothetical protein